VTEDCGGLATPVVLCVYNRPDATRALVAALRAVRPRRILVVADGPLPDRPDDGARCDAVRAIVEGIDWPASVEWNAAPANLGPRQRIRSGLDWAFARVAEAIVLEDDCIPHPSFFTFCAALLERYRDDKRIALVSGSNFALAAGIGGESYGFSRYPLIWGWATWARTWRLYDADLDAWPALRDTPWLHDLLGDALAAGYWRAIFDRIRAGLDAWDYPLTFSCWLSGGLTVQPSRNLVRNIGFGPDATNARDADAVYAHIPACAMPVPLVHAARIARDMERDRLIERRAFSGSPRGQLARLRAARDAGAAAAGTWRPGRPPS